MTGRRWLARPGARLLAVAVGGVVAYRILARRARPIPLPPGRHLATDVPVLLVPGWIDTERDLEPIRSRLVSSGWAPDAVRALTFRTPTGSNVDHADEIGAAAADLLEAAGADRLDIVAHSMGGLATRVFLARTSRVRRVVFLGSPHRGTRMAYLAWGDGGREMRPGSELLRWLAGEPDGLSRVQALTVRTPLDTRIIPNGSSVLDGVPDLQVTGPSHPGLLRDVRVFRIVRRFLSDGVVDADGVWGVTRTAE